MKMSFEDLKWTFFAIISKIYRPMHNRSVYKATSKSSKNIGKLMKNMVLSMGSTGP